MSSPVPYFDLIREMKDAYDHRLRLVDYARQNGIQAAARAFQTTVPTVRKWLLPPKVSGPNGDAAWQSLLVPNGAPFSG